VNIGVEVFAKSGALANSIATGNGAILNVAVGATVTIATSGTALLTEDSTIAGLPTLNNGSGRVVATSRKVGCNGLLLDELHGIEDPAVSTAPPPTVVRAPVWICGNSVVDPLEACDDGNLLDGDGCSSTCSACEGTCGDGILDPACETCDDGNLIDGDGCQSDCTRLTLLSCDSITVTDNAVNPSDRRVVVSCRDDAILTSPLGTPGDPTIGGGVFKVLNPSTMETASIDLPPPRWRALGRDGDGTRGYKYRDRFGTFGPCRRVVVRPESSLRGPLLRVVCRGAQIPFTLDEPTQGTLAVSLELGSGDRYCMEFGGIVVDDFGIGTNPDRPNAGQFVRKVAPAPPSCQVP
jgi:cysteine-rich repeat protein